MSDHGATHGDPAGLHRSPAAPRNGFAVLLFPGQGAQRVGMGADLHAGSAAARRVFDLADEVCGRPISRLCFEGPEEELRRTDVAQPALVAVELAALAALAGELGLAPDGLPSALGALDVRWSAGHSLGEYTACVAAGALAPEDGLRLAAERGRVMAEAPPGTMAAVLGLDAEQLEALCARAPGTAVVANDNAPGQVVISGDVEAVVAVGEAAKAAGASRVIPLNVGGAFHSPLMADAAARFARTLDGVSVTDPRIPVVGNTSGRPLATAAEVRDELRRQIAAPVRWRESLLWLRDAGASHALECGPGNVLAGLARRTTPELRVRPLGSFADVQALVAAGVA